MILNKIIEAKKISLQEKKPLISLSEIRNKAENTVRENPRLHLRRDFSKALTGVPGSISIIAEIKKASPSKGIIRENFEPLAIAYEYISHGADAISVLTEEEFFLGSDDYLAGINTFSEIPLLRKDFIIDVWQIYQSVCLGADAILLIASILSKTELSGFIAAAAELKLQCLVEVHDEPELDKAVSSGAKIIGINNRNLKTFEVDLETTAKLAPLIPTGLIKVSESGIKNPGDISYLRKLNIDAVLIGEELMKAASTGSKLLELKAAGKEQS